ncbi:hypothetical protein QE418_001056 [Microbacterium testaceum]|uniref:hypothetical protein n=1 Tax=Microbacterium TaxID=33882 RepID=UPI001AEA1594|nr:MULTISPECIES: hypothetical protein [Microbacterium]MDQ1111608.1 hypothetical protein [Microbacterium testaceum]MDR6097857.1 hypothetical protein [Microbacterium sp. SORGH_AS_0454]
MRIRTLSAVTASILAVGLMTGGAAAFAAPQSDTFVDGVPAPAGDADETPDADGVVLGGMPAPLMLTPADLAKGPVTLQVGQTLVVVLDADNGGAFTGTGGSDDDTVAHFDAAVLSPDDDEVSLNAAFSAGKAGTTKGWIAGADGQRTTFDITVAAA